MIVIGLTGGIAMGKSEVARILTAEGIPVFDSDREVHRLYDSKEGGRLLQDIAPQAVAEGRVDRAALTALVLADGKLLKKIESRVHAEIRRQRDIFLSEQREAGNSMAAIDVPLLFETGADTDVNVSLVVSAPPEVQRRRAMARPGMTEDKLAMILKRQLPDAEKRRRANFVIETNGTLEELREKVLDILRRIRREHAL